MTGTIYKTAYLSLAIPLSDATLSAQQKVCQRYALIPRTELHLTLAFFGETTARKLVDLAFVDGQSSVVRYIPDPH